MAEFDWDVLEQVARETGKAIWLGKSNAFTTTEKRKMSQEAKERKMNITMGNHARNPEESDDDLFVMKKL